MKKNILRKMSAALAGVMLLAGIPSVSAQIETDTTVVFQDNFGSYTDAADLKSVYDFWDTKVSVGTEGDNKFINVPLTSSDNNTQVNKSFGETYTAGYLNVKYSVKPAAGLTTLFYLTNGSDAKEMPRFENGEMHLDWSGTKFGTYTPGEWYDVEVDVDLDMQTYNISVKKQGSSDIPMTYNNVAVGFSGAGGLRMQVWANADGTSCFDNIEIKHTVEHEVVRFPHVQDFENIKQHSLTMRAGEIGQNGFIVNGDNNSKVFELRGTSASGAPELQFDIGETGYGRLNIEADIKTGSADCASLILLRNGDELVKQAVLLDGDRGVFNGWDNVKIAGTCAANAWYHINLMVDIDNGIIDTKVTDADGNVYSYEGFAYAEENKTISNINFQIWSGSESTYIDNVTIVHENNTLPYFQNFDSANANGMTLVNGDRKICKVVDCLEGYKKVYRLAYSDEYKTPSLKRNLGGLTAGKLGLEADIKPAGKENCQANIFLTISDPNGNKDLKNLLGFSCETGVRVGWNGTEVLPDYDDDTWYHINIIIDIANGTMDAFISDGIKLERSVYGLPVFEPGTALRNIYFQRWGNERGVLYIDNVNITDNPSPFRDPKPQKVILSESFDRYDGLDTLKSNWTMENASDIRTDLSVRDNGNKYLTLGLDSNLNNAQAYRRLPTPLREGKMRFSFDVKPGGPVSTHIALRTADGSVSPLIYFDNANKGIYAGVNWQSGEPIGYWTEDNWYNCDIVVDIDTKTIDVSCEQEGNSSTKATKNNITLLDCDKAVGNGGYENFLFQIWKNAEGTSGLDNLVMMERGMTITKASINSDGNTVTTLAGLKEAANPMIEIMCENSMKQDVSAIVYINSYKNDTLLKCQMKEIAVDANEYKAIKTLEIANDKFADADFVTLLIWDKDKMLMPLCNKIELR